LARLPGVMPSVSVTLVVGDVDVQHRRVFVVWFLQVWCVQQITIRRVPNHLATYPGKGAYFTAAHSAGRSHVLSIHN
jgi:hypothetical protein